MPAQPRQARRLLAALWFAARVTVRPPSATSKPHASTASSTPSPRPASDAGLTRATREQAAQSAFLTAADGTASPSASRPSTGPAQRSAHWSNKSSRPSSPGGSSANYAALRPGSRGSSKPSWSFNSPPRAEINPQHSPGPSIRPPSSRLADERRGCGPHRATPGRGPSNCRPRLCTSPRRTDSILTPDHRARLVSVSASRSMRHPPVPPSTTARNVITRIYQTPVTQRRSAVT